MLGQIPDMLVRPAVFICIGMMSFYLFDNIITRKASNILFINGAAVAVALFASVVLLKCRTPVDCKNVIGYKFLNIKYIYKNTKILGFISSVQIINSNLDVVMLGIFETSKNVGIYKAAATYSLLVSASLTVINQIIMSKIEVYIQGIS